MICVVDDEDGMRLDRWFKAHYPGIRHGALEKMLRKGEVRVDGGRSKANRRLAKGETVRVPPIADETAPRRPRSVSNADEIKEYVVYEDDVLIAINKPFGLAVQGGSGTTRHVDGMLGVWGDGDKRPRLVHRLDKDTGGLLLLARNRRAAQSMSAAFQRREIEKTYWALTVDVPRPREGRIDFRIAKRMVREKSGEVEKVVPATGEDARWALSDYQIIDDAERVAFLAMRPISGRTHQLRVHAAAIGCPVVGDRKYGGSTAIIEGVSPKVHLFCRSMTFRHPATSKQMTLTAPLTGHMEKTWKFFSFDTKAQCEWPEI